MSLMPIKNKGNNRIGKTRNLARIFARDTKGDTSCKMGTIKDRNSMSLAEAEDMKNCWQEYKRRTVLKKGLNHLDDHNGVVTHIEQTTWCVKSLYLRKNYHKQC